MEPVSQPKMTCLEQQVCCVHKQLLSHRHYSRTPKQVGCRTLAAAATLLTLSAWHRAFLLTGRPQTPPLRGTATVRHGWLEMLEEAVGAPTPVAPEEQIPSQPLDRDLTRSDLEAYMLEEKGVSMSGEDFEVKSPAGEVLLRIGGGNRLPTPGMPVWDKLTISTAAGKQIASLDRQAFALTTTYNLNRPDGSVFGKISKAMFAFTQTFELWEEGNSKGPLLRAEGSFSDKSYVMKSQRGEVVATVARLKGFSGGNIDNYQVIVAPKVDASLVLAMSVVIDEVHDEENPVAEGEGEGLSDLLEDAKDLPLPSAANPPIPAGTPLDAALVLGRASAYELEEKALSMSGEDFEVRSPTGELVLKIGGGNRLPIGGLPVWDRLTVSAASGAALCSLDREMVSMTPTYDVFRPDGSKFGKITKALFGFTETFEFYLEGDGNGPVLKAEGSFSERKYVFKSREGTVVGTVGRGYFQTASENRYHVVVGARVDATMVISMAVAIDEVHDEEQKAKEESGESGGFFPFR